MSNAISGIGAIFHKWVGSSWEALAEVVSITPPNPTRETIDVTTLTSTDQYREFIGGIKDGGTCTLKMNFFADTYTTIKDDFESNTKQNYEIVVQDATNSSLEFEGLVTEMPLDAIVVDDKITLNITIKVIGRPIFNAGGSSSPA